MAAPASAADLAAKPYVKAPPAPPPAIYDWTGFYIGANGGWGSAHNCWSVTPVGGVFFPEGCANRSGGLAGGQIGYRWQNNQVVFGLEGQGDWANIRGSRISLLDPTITEQAKVNGIGLFTGQIGYAWNAALLYFKGGVAVTGNSFSLLDTATGIGLATLNTTRVGGTVGVGFEYGFGPGWSVGVEYDHLFMGNGPNDTLLITGHPLLNGAINRIGEDVDMVTVRFNYRFGGGYGGPRSRPTTDFVFNHNSKPWVASGLFCAPNQQRAT
jgi:outer membrane immunogenic protein